MSVHSIKSIAILLQRLRIEDPEQFFKEAESLEDEFKLVKKAYFALILVLHPDKGGDAEDFREVQTSFELLRELKSTNKIVTFAVKKVKPKTKKQKEKEVFEEDDEEKDFNAWYESRYEAFRDMPVPPHEYYARAEEDSVPIYRVVIFLRYHHYHHHYVY